MKEKIKNQKVKSILAGILIGVVVFPTIALGGTFVSSLIQGKTVEEAVQILAEQVDFLIGRIEIVETKQADQEQTISELQTKLAKQQACREADRLFFYIPPEPDESVKPDGWHRLASYTNNIVELYNAEKSYDSNNPDFLLFITPAYEDYLATKAECEK